jgi:hypothetical protein
MPLYRAYLVDESGRMVGAIDLECADDEEAREKAKWLGDGDVEVKLWREIPLIEPESPPIEPEGQ